ncbi:beta-L-arabinofuranosidase domain-containing protein [Chryseobacterium wanjuense]
MNKKSLILFLGFGTLAFGQGDKTVSYFPLNKVALSESVFSRAMQTDKNYIMSMDADRLLAPYLKEAELNPKKQNYPNWENTGLDGHIGGHYISALALMYASTGDTKVKQRLDYMIDELERCQNLSGNGYLSGVPGGKNMERNLGR